VISTQWMVLACGLALLGCLHYSWTTATGSSRPNLVTWSIWSVVPTVAFAAQIVDGVGLPAALTLMAGLGPAIVVATAVVTRHFHARWTLLDTVCGVLAVIALIGWLAADSPAIAVVLAVVADGLVLIPTVVKAWGDPSSENAWFFVAIGVAATITLLVLSERTVTSAGFAVYQLSACTILVAILLLRARTSTKSPSR